MNTIINLTPHLVALYNIADCTEVQQGQYKSLTLKEGAQPLAVFPSKGVARATATKAVVDQLEIADQVVAINATTYGEPEGLPEAAEGTYYIVSALTAQAARDRHDLLIVDGTVRDADNRICGCTAFGRVQLCWCYELDSECEDTWQQNIFKKSYQFLLIGFFLL